MSRFTHDSTDHSAEVLLMRAATVTAREKAATARSPISRDLFDREALILDAAADLLECHDATGVTLDEWSGPKALVHAALELVGLEPERLLHHTDHPTAQRSVTLP